MKIQIYLTNGKDWALDVGNTRINQYHTLKELYEALTKIIKLTEDKE